MVDVVADLGAVMLGSRLKRLAERLQASAATLLTAAQVPLQPGQVALLVALESGPKTVGRIAEDTGTSQPGVTRTLSQLEEARTITPVADVAISGGTKMPAEPVLRSTAGDQSASPTVGLVTTAI